jgi:hypothetical protein
MSFSRCLFSATVAIASAACAYAGTPTIAVASLNGAGTQLTITGTNLLGPSGAGVQSITFDGIPVIPITETATSIIVNNPATSLTPGLYPVVVSFLGAPTATVSYQVPVGPSTRLLFTGIEGPDQLVFIISNISLDQTTGGTAIPGSCVMYMNPLLPNYPLTFGVAGGETTTIGITTPNGYVGYALFNCSFKAQGVMKVYDPTAITLLTVIPAVVNP